jgi:hypothetical protein
MRVGIDSFKPKVTILSLHRLDAGLELPTNRACRGGKQRNRQARRVPIKSNRRCNGIEFRPLAGKVRTKWC